MCYSRVQIRIAHPTELKFGYCTYAIAVQNLTHQTKCRNGLPKPSHERPKNAGVLGGQLVMAVTANEAGSNACYVDGRYGSTPLPPNGFPVAAEAGRLQSQIPPTRRACPRHVSANTCNRDWSVLPSGRLWAIRRQSRARCRYWSVLVVTAIIAFFIHGVHGNASDLAGFKK
jgi:hypothetical protein